MSTRTARTVLALIGVIALQGCSDRVVEPRASAPAETAVGRIECTASVRLSKVTCAAPKSKANSDIAFIALGGQGTYVNLRTSNVSYNSETKKFFADVAVQNLTAMKLGTDASGEALFGFHVIITSGPHGDGGIVTVNNADDNNMNVIGAGQPGFFYNEILDPYGGTSSAKMWAFDIPTGVETFVFTAVVYAAVAPDNEVLRWTVEHGFAGFGSPDYGSGIVIAGNDPRNLFAFTSTWSRNTLERFDGVAWHTADPSFPIAVRAAWVGSPRDVWAGGENGQMAHYDGSSWVQSVIGENDYECYYYSICPVVFSIWGASTNNVYAVTNSGTYHYDGTSWTYDEGISASYWAVHGTSANDIWLVGYGTALHYNGEGWVETSPPAEADLYSVYSAGGKAWAVGYQTLLYWNGTTWTAAEGVPETGFTAVRGTSTDNVWAIGYSGKVVKWKPNTTSWEVVPLSFATSTDFDGLWVGSANDVWIIGQSDGVDQVDGLPIHWDGTSWTVLGRWDGSDIRAVFGTSPTTTWAVGPDNVLHNTGTGWKQVPTNPDKNDFMAVWGSSDSNVWMVGYAGVIQHWNGTALVDVESPTYEDLVGMWGFAANDIWAVGSSGAIIHYDGTAWTNHSQSGVTNTDFYAVWGANANDLWIVGYRYRLHYLNGTWTTYQDCTEGCETWNAVHGTSASNVVFVGQYGRIFRYNGEGTTDESIDWSTDLYGVYSDGAGGHMYAVGSKGAVFRHTPSGWVRVNAGVSTNIFAIWMSSLSNIYVVGYGWIAHGSR